MPNVVPGTMDAFKAPMLHDPGERYTYGINTDWLGRVVEAVAGTTLDVVVKENITGPLGMDDTMFVLDAGRTKNAVTVHVPGEDGGWASSGEFLNQSPEWWAGGHGLYSTPRDFLRFQRALLRGGSSTGCGSSRPRRSTRRSPTRSATWTSRQDIPTADPPVDRRLQRGARGEVGLRAAAEHRRPPGHAPGRLRRVGGPVQHPLLGRPHHRRLRVDLHATRCRSSSPRAPGRCTATSSGPSTRRSEPQSIGNATAAPSSRTASSPTSSAGP